MGKIADIATDWAELKDSWGFLEALMTELPEEFSACSVIISEIVEGISYAVANIAFGAIIG